MKITPDDYLSTHETVSDLYSMAEEIR